MKSYNRDRRRAFEGRSGEISRLDINVDKGMLDKAVNQQCVQYFLPAALNNFPAPAGSNSADNDNLIGFYCPVDMIINSVILTLDTAIASGDSGDYLAFNVSDGTNELLSANVSAVAGVAQYESIVLACDQNNKLSAGDMVYVRLDVYDDGADGDPPEDLSSATGYVTINYSLR